LTLTCQILRLKCIKFDFGWGLDPDPAGGSLQEGREGERRGKERGDLLQGVRGDRRPH